MFQVETISPKMLDYYVGKRDVYLIDLRTEKQFRKSHIRTAHNFPYKEFDEKWPYPKEKTLILYCDRGGASLLVARQLAKRGYRTRSLVGGFEGYKGRNLVIL